MNPFSKEFLLAISRPVVIQPFRVMTGPCRVLPDFMIIGCMRGGTTSLYTYLVEHPSIVSASTKEVHYFDRYFPKGMNWYKAHFPTFFCKAYMTRLTRIPFVTGEATPYYLFHPLAIKRIHALIPGVKLIVLLRNPVDRAFSHYLLEVGIKNETLRFEVALEREETRLQGEADKIRRDDGYYSFNYQHYSYLTRGLYLRQIQDVLSYFSKDQLLIECSEEFYADPYKTVKRVLEFLNLPDWKQEKYDQYNSSLYALKEPMSEDLRKRLIEYFRPHNEQLYQFLGRRFDWDR